MIGDYVGGTVGESIIGCAWGVWQYRLLSFQVGDKNWKDFCLKINIPKGNDLILRIGVVESCQKLGIVLVIK